MYIGVTIPIEHSSNIEVLFSQAQELGIRSCQIVCWDEEAMTSEKAEEIQNARRVTGMAISGFWCGWNGPRVWDFQQGPITLGLVPAAYRFQRIQTLLAGCSFACEIGVKNLITHAGFLPENPAASEYAEVCAALQIVVDACKAKDINFLFETGQETPVTLKRTIQDLGEDHIGINLDPANLIMYGKANPVDALEVFGEYVMDVHGKDGMYPTDGHQLGKEVPLGEGKVDYPRFIAKLKEIGYDGAITIEREISGEQQIKDIISAKKLLEPLLW
ncbi:sugar phosphate isomerase/epimerase family protein [Sediminispirochaeta bajacaliforniensis]|uniref:sugar phosphate isomerase/epimerase family protein n=1 Tax=Sediminispirochaeta bajacaliforniensis TaxID=148 RepID=UPI000363A6A2|nr:sugar phosphate isomerase/epimerase family protein [Sediminispirochaeta bajacaliforniensis]